MAEFVLKFKCENVENYHFVDEKYIAENKAVMYNENKKRKGEKNEKDYCTASLYHNASAPSSRNGICGKAC